MSFLSNIFKTDSEKAAEPQPAPAAPTPVQETQPDPAPAPAPDPFDTLWTPDDSANKGQGLNFNIDPAQLAEIAGKIDYTQAITPEIRQRLAMGGEDAVAATMEALNVVNRLGYQQNAIATTKLIEAAVKNTEAAMDEKIQRTIKSMGLAENVTASNPALSNPAFAPVVKAAQQQIIAKFPNATQAELNQYLNRYLTDMGAAFNPDLVKKASAPASFSNTVSNSQPEQDWSAWLSGN